MSLMKEPTNPKWISLDHLYDFIKKKSDKFGLDLAIDYVAARKAGYTDINSTDVWTGNLADEQAASASTEVDAMYAALDRLKTTVMTARDSTELYIDEEQ